MFKRVVGWAGLLAACGDNRVVSSSDAVVDVDAPADSPVDSPVDTALDATSDGPDLDATALYAIGPNLAAVGDLLRLEGTFESPTTASFPGGITGVATVLGTHRATVTVPAAAATGLFSVGSGPAPVPFRRVSFAAAPRTSAIRGAQTTTAERDPVMTLERAGHTATVIGPFLYLIGNPGSEVRFERARINADGSLGNFELVTDVLLTVPRSGHTATVIGNHLYLIGGTFGGGDVFHDSIERAPILPDGTLGKFAVVPNVTLNDARGNHTAHVIGDGLYIFGGNGNAAQGSQPALDTVERATIRADGSVGAFERLPGKLASIRTFHTSAVVGDFVYLLGGANGDVLLTAIERAPIAADGSLGSFAVVAGRNLVTPRSAHSSYVLGGRIYMLGGASGLSLVPDIESASIATDGTIGQFQLETAKMGSPRAFTATAIVENTVLSCGGVTSFGGEDPKNCDRGSVLGAATPGPFATSSALSTGRAGGSVIAIGRHLYMIGGSSGNAVTGSVERADVALDGTLGTFASQSITLATARANHSTLVAGVTVLVLGGRDGAGAPLATIERATIADGEPGNFVAAVSTLATARHNHASVVIGNRAYVIGGIGAGGALASVESAPLSPTGGINVPFTSEASVLVAPRSGHSVAVLGNAVYVIGGRNAAGNAVATIERAVIGVDGSPGSFTTVANRSLATARSNHASMVIGGSLFVFGGTAASGLSTIEIAAIGVDGTLGTFSVAAASLSTVRVEAGAVTLGNFVYVIGGVGTAGTSFDHARLQ